MPVYDVDKIENLYEDFLRCKKSFKNNEYDNFYNGYLFSLSDRIVVKLRKKLSTLYSNINTGYNNIDKYWEDYINDIKSFDRCVADKSSVSAGNAEVSSLVSQIASIDLGYSNYDMVASAKSMVADTTWGIQGNDILNSIIAFLTRTGATIVNFVFSLLGGIVQFAEALLDGAVLIVGSVIGLGVWIFTGFNNETTRGYFNDMLNAVAGHSWSKDAKNWFYSTSFGKAIDMAAFDWARSDGGIYEFGEAIGYVAGVVILTACTFGAGGAVTAATQVSSGVVAGVASFGKTTTKQYNEYIDGTEDGKKQEAGNATFSGKDMATMLGISAVTGTVEGVTFALTYGNGLKTTGIKGYLKAHPSSEKVIKAGMQFTKTVVVDGVTAINPYVDFDWKETLSSATASAVVSFAYDSITGAKYGDALKANAAKHSKNDLIDEYADKLLKTELKKIASENGLDADELINMVDNGIDPGSITDDIVTGEFIEELEKETLANAKNMMDANYLKIGDNYVKDNFGNNLLYYGTKKIVGKAVKDSDKEVVKLFTDKLFAGEVELVS